MAIRPPRPTRQPRAPNQSRDIVIVGIVSIVVVLFGLRLLLSLVSLAERTIFWRVVAGPTDVLVRPLELVPALDRTVVAQLSAAELLAAAAVGLGALFVLSSLALRRQ